MRKLVYLAGWLVLLACGAARAEDDVKAIVEKAIKAHGGADVLDKFPAMTVKAKGKFYGIGEGIDYTAEVQFQAPDKHRREVQGEGFKFVGVVNGDKGWHVFSDKTMEMDKEHLVEAQEDAYATNLGRLTPLSGKGYKLSPLGEVKVGDRLAVGVRVEHKGRRDVNLFFDKESGLLVKTERLVKDLMAGGKEYTQETILGNYKKVDGLQVAYKVTLKRDGKLYVEGETTEAKPAEKLDDSVFGKP